MGLFINDYCCLTLNGQTYSKSQLSEYCLYKLSRETLANWERVLYQFCIEWISEDDYVIAHTSGSTGDPKPLKLHKRHMIASAKKTIDYFNLHSGDSALLPLSAQYIAGKMMLVRAFVGQLNIIVIEPTSNPLSLIKHRIKFVPLVPMQVVKALETVKEEWPVDIVIIGGGVLANTYKEKLKKRNTAFYETYGMTETVSHIALKSIQTDQFTALEGVMLSLDNRNCLCIDAPDVTPQHIVTNDIVNLHSSNSFSFVGRYDNVINTGAVKIVPELLEKKISKVLKVPFVVSSIPHDVYGEQLVLVLTDSSFDDSDFDNIKKMPSLNKFEIPKRYFIIKEFPMTGTSKIKREFVKKMIN